MINLSEKSNSSNECLKAFIFLFSCGLDVDGWYDGSHVISTIFVDDGYGGSTIYADETGEIKMEWEELRANDFIPLKHYGLPHLLASFTHLTERERKLLTSYFAQDKM